MSVLENIKRSTKFIDLRFTDTKGKEQHVTVPTSVVDESFFKNGKMFDGSSIAGWKGINESDMILMPDRESFVSDPFFQDTGILRCDVIEPTNMQGYDRDPRTVAKRAEEYLKLTGIADTALFGPEPEFFIFNGVRWGTDMNHTFFEITSDEGAWDSKTEVKYGNKGHRPAVKGGYFPVPPVDSMMDVRSVICDYLQAMGVEVEAHHHEVATAGQNEIGTGCNTLVRKADELQIFKYVVHNTAERYGCTATFMPKPLVGDNGNGMHVHQSLSKEGKNIFDGLEYGDLSQEALWYIGGIFKHAKALNAFTNATTNSYKRLIPGFEAPVILAYSARNRSAAVRIPFVSNRQATRIEVRFPDASGNPYFTFAAMLLAGIDGIRNKCNPGDPVEEDLYETGADDHPDGGKRNVVSGSLEESLKALHWDRHFLTGNGVFTDDTINAYIELKQEEINRLKQATHPVEFEMYYSV